MPNVKFPQYTRRTKEAALAEGFKIGVLTFAVMFRDRYEVSDEQVEDMIAETVGLMLAFGNGEYNPKYMLRDLEKKLGVKFDEVVGG